MKRTFLLLPAILFSIFLQAQTPDLPSIQLINFASGFINPVDIQQAGDSRLFIVEQAGIIRVVDSTGQIVSTFLDIRNRVHSGGEQGMLGLAFDPDYIHNGFFYLHYTNRQDNNRISRFTANPTNPNQALHESEVILLEDEDPYANHNGGQLTFGPDDYLYFGIGDGGSAGDPENRAQDISSIQGKLLRIVPLDDGSYDIPDENPYVGIDGAREEIWATGLRNPWRFSFDKFTGDLWIADVGQDSWEEINFQQDSTAGGDNYGWSCMEGNHFFKTDCAANATDFTDPIAEYAHAEGYPCGGSVTGGYVYRGNLFVDMYGKYFYIDFCTGILRTTYMYGSGWATEVVANLTPAVFSTFGEDINGELYLANKSNGVIYRIIDNSGALALPEVVETETTPEKTEGQANFMLSPNPNQGTFNVRFESGWKDQSAYVITDVMGRTIIKAEKEVIKGRNDWTFDQKSLAPGRYVLQIQTSYGLHTMHFIAE